MELELDLTKPNDINAIRAVAKALSDIIRLRILLAIKEDQTKNLNYGEISSATSKSNSAITNHMRWLRLASLIEDALIDGKRGKQQKIPSLKYSKITINL